MHNVFYMGQIVAGADAFFFKVLGSGYAKDHDHVYQYGQLLSGVDPFHFKPPTNTGMMMNPIMYHQHHPLPVPSYTSSTYPVYIHTNPPPIPVIPTNNVAAHVDLSGRTIGGQYTRTNDSLDCCVLI
jgi:hypothetical protein